MMTRVQIEQQAHDLRVLVCQNARLDGFRFDVVLDAIDRAHHLGVQHIATRNRIIAEIEKYRNRRSGFGSRSV